jgi:tetratricopeptide (TPR) repeat protein
MRAVASTSPFATGKYDRARKIYRQVRHKAGAVAGQTDPFARGKIANMHADTSQAYQDAGMASEAILELEKAVLLCPSFADLRTKLAQLYRDAGDNGRAMAQLEAAKEANPRYLNARLMLGVLLLTTGERQRATQEFEAALEIAPKNQRAEMYLRIVNSQLATSEAPSAPPSES